MANDDQCNDVDAAELISKSFHGSLDDAEKRQMERTLTENSEAHAFKQISALIQNSVTEVAAKSLAGDTSIAPGMTSDAKQRLRESIDRAKSQSVHFRGDTQSGVDASSVALASSHVEGDIRQATARFRLIRRIGEGGLGSVWLAYDEKVKRKVAIKCMTADAVQSPKAWERFHREAEVTGLLEHPNVVPLYQYGSDPKTGEPFYVMRFVGKRTLSNAIVEYHELFEMGEVDELAMHRLLTVFLDVCQAIAYAHSRGVIHRDLKPDNVALDSFGQVVVLDWGLAKILDEGDLGHPGDRQRTPTDLGRTMVGDIVGTPLYMSPEQAAGDHESIDERTDIYGLGAILFSILTGAAPHEKTNTSGDGRLRMSEFLESIATSEAPLAREYFASAPRELERICQKAMARKQFARYQSASDLAQAVERWMAGQSDKSARYEKLRMEGRELRASFQSTANTLATNARFVSTLPPIQELAHVESEEESTVWRKRLATIFTGLLGAIPDYISIVYSRIDGDRFEELVRVERHQKDHAKVRPIPRSRLKSGECNAFVQQVMNGNPDEVVSSLICNEFCDESECDRPRLVAGIPIYDDETEEPFGVILIACNLEMVFERQMNRSHSAFEIMAACDTHHVMMHNVESSMADGNLARAVADVSPHFLDAVAELQTSSEYIDETDHEVYGARLWLIPKKHGLMYLLRAKT